MGMLPSTWSLGACALWAAPCQSRRQVAQTSKLKKRLHGVCGQWTESRQSPSAADASNPVRVHRVCPPPHVLVSSRMTRRQLSLAIASCTSDEASGASMSCPPLCSLMSKMKIHASATFRLQTSPSSLGKQQIVVVAPSSQLHVPCHIARPGAPMCSADHPCTCKAHRDA